VLIPEAYVADLGVRLGLYRRLSDIADTRDVEAFAAELIDRFGPLPAEVENLLQLLAIKRLCREAGVEKVDAGPKGVTIAFRNNSFSNPNKLVELIQKESPTMKVRPDQRLVWMRDFEDKVLRVKGVEKLLGRLAAYAAGIEPGADTALPPPTPVLVKPEPTKKNSFLPRTAPKGAFRPPVSSSRPKPKKWW
jgi:transcription-repair coupling factor (superfamily II helicase)